MSEEAKSTTKQCEELYPETTSEFKKILKEQYDLFCRKQLNYGCLLYTSDAADE